MSSESFRRELLLRWLVALGGAAVLLFFFSPNWAFFALGSRVTELQALPEWRRGATVVWQASHLGEPVPDALHAAVQWRLLFPAVANVLGLPAGVLLGLAHVGALLVLGYVVTLLRRAGRDWNACAAAVLLFGAAGWFLASTSWLGYYDSWTVLGLLILAFSPARWALWAACVWAPWVDERFVLGAPLALGCAYLWRRDGTRGPAWHWLRDLAVPAALLGAFVAIRLGVLAGRSVGNAKVADYLAWLNFEHTTPGRVALGVWEGWRAGWGFVAVALVLTWRQYGAAIAAALVGAVLAVAITGLATAQDFSRSLLFLSPVVVLGFLAARENPENGPGAVTRCGTSRLAMWSAVAVTLLLPAHLVTSDLVRPVYYLHHELAAFENPPAYLMPERYELRAIEAMQAGDTPRAEHQLTLAIKLARQPAGALKQRGVLRASNGRWPEARADFAAMVEAAPQDPESWFFRAQAEFALGNVAGARSDLESALARAPAEWAQRPDVTRFRQKLAAAK